MKKYIKFSFEITHLCNKYCADCSHRLKSSDYKYLTISEYEKIYQSIKHLSISEIEITGGEPLMHPNFNELIERISNDFVSSRIVLKTNGKLLPRLNGFIRNYFDRIYITYYEGFNETEIDEVINEKNMVVNQANFIKLDNYEILKIEDAKRIFNRCPNKTYRFVGTKLYECCMAESIERTFLNHEVHTDIIDDISWQKNIKNIPTYKACQYCILADSMKYLWNLNNVFRLLKQYMLFNSPLANHDFTIIWFIRRYFKNVNNFYKYQNKF